MKQPKKSKYTWRRRPHQIRWDEAVYLRHKDLPKDFSANVDCGHGGWFWCVDSDTYIEELVKLTSPYYTSMDDAKKGLVKVLQKFYKEQAAKYARIAKVFE